jgi:hypothetical protein
VRTRKPAIFVLLFGNYLYAIALILPEILVLTQTLKAHPRWTVNVRAEGPYPSQPIFITLGGPQAHHQLSGEICGFFSPP